MGSAVLRIEVSSTSLRMELSMSDTKTVSPLRQRMIEDMAARKLNPHTQRSHISSCKRFAAFGRAGRESAYCSKSAVCCVLPNRHRRVQNAVVRKSHNGVKPTGLEQGGNTPFGSPPRLGFPLVPATSLN